MSKVRDDALFSILAELAGPRLHELKPYEAICWPCCGSCFWCPLGLHLTQALDRAGLAGHQSGLGFCKAFGPQHVAFPASWPKFSV